jgi:ribosomal protein L6P/L9E
MICQDHIKGINFGYRVELREEGVTYLNKLGEKRAVQCSAVQYSTVKYSTVQGSTVQCSTVQCSTAKYSTVQCRISLYYSAVQYS